MNINGGTKEGNKEPSGGTKSGKRLRRTKKAIPDEATNVKNQRIFIGI